MNYLKKAYLTIDDSPTTEFKAKVDFLLSKNIPAVFFCIGQLLEQRPAVVIEAIQKGFIIANHSYSHPAFSRQSLEACQLEIEKTDTIIDQLYQHAGVVRPAKWFRFPYGDKGDLKNGKVFSRWRWGSKRRKHFIQKVLKKLNYSQPDFSDVHYQFMRKAGLFHDIDWSWTFDVMEWALTEKKSTLGLDRLDKIMERLTQEHPKDCRGSLGREKRWLSSDSAEVILLHDHEATHAEFYTIIDKLLALRLSFQSFDKLK